MNTSVTSTNSHHQDDEEEQELAAPSSRENGDCEADLKAMEGWLVFRGIYTSTSNWLIVNILVSTSSHQDDKEVQEQTYSSPREEGDQLKSQTHPSPEYCEAELKPLEGWLVYIYFYVKWADGEHISVYQLSSSRG